MIFLTFASKRERDNRIFCNNFIQIDDKKPLDFIMLF